MKKKKSIKIYLLSAMALSKNHIHARIARLINTGFKNVIPVLDNKEELKLIENL